jgi:hypothetical protein
MVTGGVLFEVRIEFLIIIWKSYGFRGLNIELIHKNLSRNKELSFINRECQETRWNSYYVRKILEYVTFVKNWSFHCSLR